MKFQILQSDINKGLSVVSRVTAARGQLPILNNILIESLTDGVRLSATNLEIGLRTSIGGKVTEEGSLTVPARALTEFVSSLSSGTLNFSTEAEKLKVQGSHNSAVFSGISASEFPKLPDLNKLKPATSMTARDLGEVAREVAFAAASDESRPVLTGIKFQPFEDYLEVVATDGFRLSLKKVIQEKTKVPGSVILPARTVLELARLVSEKDIVETYFLEDSNQVVFSLGKSELVSRLLEGNFPDIHKIIPKESGTSVTIDRAEWLAALKSTAIFARENNNIVRFKIADSSLTMTAVAANVGENTSEIEADMEGTGGEIVFNCKFVLDFLTNTESERVTLKFTDATSPGIFTPEKGESFLHLIMPVRLQS